MKRATIPSPPCASVCSIESKRVPRAVVQDNGVRAKRKCWHPPIRKRAEDTATDGIEKVAEIAQAMDKAEVEDRFRQEVFGDGRSLRSICNDQKIKKHKIGQGKACGGKQKETSRDQKGQAIRQARTAQGQEEIKMCNICKENGIGLLCWSCSSSKEMPSLT